VEVVSATALDERQKERLMGALSHRLRRDVRLHCHCRSRVDRRRGGAFGDLLIDGSLKSKLEAPRADLTG